MWLSGAIKAGETLTMAELKAVVLPEARAARFGSCSETWNSTESGHTFALAQQCYCMQVAVLSWQYLPAWCTKWAMKNDHQQMDRLSNELQAFPAEV